MKNFLFLSTAAMVMAAAAASPAYAAEISCTQAPTCESLGYTDSSYYCPNHNIKCPFSTSKVKCIIPVAETGWFFYSDGSVSESYNKTSGSARLTGIVYDTGGSTSRGTVTEVMLLVARKNVTYEAAVKFCESYGASLPPLSAYTTKINNAFKAAGKNTLVINSSDKVWMQSTATYGNYATGGFNGSGPNSNASLTANAYCVMYNVPGHDS